MNSIVINKIDQIIMITNQKYKNVRHIGNITHKCPDIGAEYIYLQWGDDVWFENYYVDKTNQKFFLSPNQEVITKEVCSNWEQDLGQEGNPTLDQAKEKSKIDMMISFSSATNQLNNRTTSHEMSSWSVQIDEAKAIKINQSVSTPLIETLVVTRNLGETKTQLADKIISKYNTYNVEYGKLLGKYQSLCKQVENSTTVADVLKITW